MLNRRRLSIVLVAATILTGAFTGCGEGDKSKRLSPPETATETTSSGNTITINYSKPSLKGRRIGKDVAPFGKVWGIGDNEATTFEITKDAKIEGKALPKGKYSLYAMAGEKTWTIIFNKNWNQWAVEYNQADDALRVPIAPATAFDYREMMNFIIERDGRVLLFWGDYMVGFRVQ